MKKTSTRKEEILMEGMVDLLISLTDLRADLENGMSYRVLYLDKPGQFVRVRLNKSFAKAIGAKQAQ